MNLDKNCNFKLTDGCLEILVDAAIYPKEPLLVTCCVFMDDFYVLLDFTKDKKKYRVLFEVKPGSGKKIDMKDLGHEFYNELLNNVLRYQISSRNQSIKEYIVREALFFNQPKKEQEKFIQCACRGEKDGQDKS